MDNFHKTLNRQLKKHFGKGNPIPKELTSFLEDVSSVYSQQDKDMRFMQHSMDISSEELQTTNQEMGAIMRSMPDLFFRTTFEGKILDVKSANIYDFIMPVQALFGKQIHKIPFKKAAIEIEKALLEVQQNGTVSTALYSIPFPSGKRYFSICFAPALEKQFIAIIRNRTVEAEAEEKHKSAYSLLQAIHNATQSGILAVDRDGRMMGQNKRFLEMWRLDESDMAEDRKGSPIDKILPDLVEPEKFVKRIQELYNSPETESFDLIEFKDGRVFERVSRPQIQEGKVIGRVWSFNDVTRLRATELAEREQKLFLRSILDGTPNLICLKNLDGSIELINQAFANIVGLSFEEIEGKKSEDFEHIVFTPSSDSICVDEEFCLKSGSIQFTEEVITNVKENTSATYLTSYTIFKGIRSGEPKILCVSTDITARKRAQEEQGKLLQQLEDVNNELQQFAYSVSHDLKAPLRAIDSLTNWLLADHSASLNEQGQELIELINGRVKRMYALIEGILAYSKLGRENEVKVPVNLNETLRDVVETLAPPPHISITVSPDLPVLDGEKIRIFQLFQNLVGNAVKYMDKPKGKIVVEALEKEAHWQLSIKDNGSGIPEKHLKNIFQIFQTLQKSDDIHSTGIGLALVKKTVELNGGSIWVESKLGEGANFIFTWPKRSEESVQKETRATGLEE
ncbi:MAG: ATP-binding protein [Calditrichia bacterium]